MIRLIRAAPVTPLFLALTAIWTAAIAATILGLVSWG